MKIILIVSLLLLAYGQLVCLHADTSTGCKECVPYYYVNTLQCVQCTILGCSICTDNITCTTCKTGYTLANSSACVSCPKGQFWNQPTTNCLPCIANCSYCADSTTCFECRPGFYLSAPTACQNISQYAPATADPIVQRSYLLALMPTSRSRLFTSNDLSYACYSNLYSCLCANLTVTSRCETFDIAAVNAVYKSYALVSIASISQVEAYSLSIESVLGSSQSTVEVLTKLNSFNYTAVLTGGLRDYSLMLETAAKLYYDWTTFDSLATFVTKLSTALIADAQVGLLAGESVTL